MRNRQLKTYMMLLLEHERGQTIEQLMLEAFRQHGTEKGAAESMGITQQSYNVWKYRLGLEKEINMLRQVLFEQAR